MKKLFVWLLVAAVAAGMSSCGDKKKSVKGIPANFGSIGDEGRVAWIMQHAEPDSVARFIIHGALGEIPGVKIDTLAIATNYAYEKYRGADLDKFGAEYDAIVESLSLSRKMKVYSQAGTEDPQGLGYKLGLEYVSSIRDKQMKVADVEKEVEELRKACGSDTATFSRFIIGFKTVLDIDSGKGIPQDVYQKFINY